MTQVFRKCRIFNNILSIEKASWWGQRVVMTCQQICTFILCTFLFVGSLGWQWTKMQCPKIFGYLLLFWSSKAYLSVGPFVGPSVMRLMSHIRRCYVLYGQCFDMKWEVALPLALLTLIIFCRSVRRKAAVLHCLAYLIVFNLWRVEAAIRFFV